MKLEEIIGKTITNIYCVSGTMDGWLDTAHCYVELEGNLIIEIPSGYSREVHICELPADAGTIFGDFEDVPHYYISKEEKSISEVKEKYEPRKKNIFNRIRKALFGQEVILQEYKPWKVEYKENKLKYLPNRKIVDILWFENEKEKGYLLLDNGYVITQTLVAAPGIGAGLYFYDSLNDVEELKNERCTRFSENS